MNKINKYHMQDVRKSKHSPLMMDFLFYV